MALYYQNFSILVVFVSFLHTSWTSVLPAHAGQRLGAGFRGQSRRRAGEPGKAPAPGRRAGTLPRSPPVRAQVAGKKPPPGGLDGM